MVSYAAYICSLVLLCGAILCIIFPIIDKKNREIKELTKTNKELDNKIWDEGKEIVSMRHQISDLFDQLDNKIEIIEKLENTRNKEKEPKIIFTEQHTVPVYAKVTTHIPITNNYEERAKYELAVRNELKEQLMSELTPYIEYSEMVDVKFFNTTYMARLVVAERG